MWSLCAVPDDRLVSRSRIYRAKTASPTNASVLADNCPHSLLGSTGIRKNTSTRQAMIHYIRWKKKKTAQNRMTLFSDSGRFGADSGSISVWVKKTAVAYAGGSESFGVSPLKHGWKEKKVSREPTFACLFRGQPVWRIGSCTTVVPHQASSVKLLSASISFMSIKPTP